MSNIDPITPLTRDMKMVSRSGNLTENGYFFLNNIWRNVVETSHRTFVVDLDIGAPDDFAFETNTTANYIGFIATDFFDEMRNYDIVRGITNSTIDYSFGDTVEFIFLNRTQIDIFFSQIDATDEEFFSFLNETFGVFEESPYYVGRTGAIELMEPSLANASLLFYFQTVSSFMYVDGALQAFS